MGTSFRIVARFFTSNKLPSTSNKQEWNVLRMDDHGRTSVVHSGFLTKEQAEEWINSFEKRSKTPWGEGHKQVYWTEEVALNTKG
jgi:hypothetical protein